ncbi:MAG TPA: 2-hydroxychromene-2-carboxylate isomerase [Casimicrobiaceae bacterium]|jgi:2-hydroxychromene-2-carboxylate isomerase|nr:2-hydroxychromene-2-carboxylate isomerase [Casimicrobiaceae bacterium]
MPSPLRFHFDFSSPYGYLASQRIESLAARHGRAIEWRPMLLGAAFKIAGTQPLTSIPLKGDYARRDLPRTARFHGIEFRMPSTFPIATQAPARIVVWQRSIDPVASAAIVHALYRAYFVEDRDISNPDVAAEAASVTGVSRDAARAAIDDPAIKDALRRDVDAAISAGVFGSPFVFVDGEPFWGFDRFEQIERWLAQGGF